MIWPLDGRPRFVTSGVDGHLREVYVYDRAYCFEIVRMFVGPLARVRAEALAAELERDEQAAAA